MPAISLNQPLYAVIGSTEWYFAARERKSLVGQDGLAAGFGHNGSKQRNSSDGMRHQLPALDAASKQHSKPAVLKRNESIESDDADEPGD